MGETPNVSESLRRLEVIFREMIGVELVDTDAAELAGLDEEECRILLRVLEETGARERRRSCVFVCRSSNWSTATAARS